MNRGLLGLTLLLACAAAAQAGGRDDCRPSRSRHDDGWRDRDRDRDRGRHSGWERGDRCGHRDGDDCDRCRPQARRSDCGKRGDWDRCGSCSRCRDWERDDRDRCDRDRHDRDRWERSRHDRRDGSWDRQRIGRTLEAIGFVLRSIDGRHYRDYECGCRHSWRQGRWDDRSRGWQPGGYHADRSCRQHS